MDERLVTVVITNWNGMEFLPVCLDALAVQTFQDYEVVVVDNASTDNSQEYLAHRRDLPIRVLVNSVNLGFAGGTNVGIQQSRSPYVVTLNNDTKADAKWLEALVDAAATRPGVGMFASRIMLMQCPEFIDSTGVNIYGDGMSKQRQHLKHFDSHQPVVMPILLPSACAAMYRREMLETTGLFDESFFAYCEDADLGLRGRLYGWDSVLVANAVVYHAYSGTGGPWSAFKAFHVERNHYFVALKSFPPAMLMMVPVWTIKRLAFHAWKVLGHRAGSSENRIDKGALLVAFLRAYLSVLVHLPKTLRKRLQIRRNARVTNRLFTKTLRSHAVKLNELWVDDVGWSTCNIDKGNTACR